MLFSDQRKHEITIPNQTNDNEPVNVAFLIRWLCENLMKDARKDLFVLDDTVYVRVA